MYWIQLGKEALSSLCPRGFSIPYQFNTPCTLVCVEFQFRLDSLCARDRGGSYSSLWWIHALLPSAKLLGFTSSLGSTFLSVLCSEKTPFLLGNSSIPPKPWSDSSIPLVGMFTRSLWSCLQNLVRFGFVLILQLSSLVSNREQKQSFCVGLNFSYHQLNRRCQWFNRCSIGVFDLGFWLHRCISIYVHRINQRYHDACCFARSTGV